MSKHRARKQLEKVAVVTESPDDCRRTWDTVNYLIEPLEKLYNVSHISLLEGDPRNGKAATKTEIKHSLDNLWEELEGFRYVVLVGNSPLKAVTGKAGISKLRGKPIKQNDFIFLPMNNPSIIRHDDKQELLLQADLQFLQDMVNFGGVPETKELDFRIVMCHDDVEEMLDDIRGAVSYDIETTQLYPWQTQHLDEKTNEWVKDPEPKIVSIGFGTARHQWCIPVGHPQSPWSQYEVADILDRIDDKRDDFFLIAHNGKFDLLWTWVHLGVKWELDFDTMLAHYLLDENMRHGLKYLAQVYCNAPDWEIDLTEKQGVDVPLKRHCKYLAHDLYYTRKLRYVLGRMLREDTEVRDVFEEILLPTANLFVEVEYDGVFIDINQFDEAESVLRDKYNQALLELEEWEPDHYVKKNGEVYYFKDARRKKDPTRFNWGSTDQLRWLLFDHLGIKPLDKTAAGEYSTSESVIKRLDHPCTEALLHFRAAKQQLSFFIDGWKPYLDKKNRGYYLHPSFKLHGAVTGRLSCEHPNLQQVPRDPRIRSLISAEEGWTLVQCDLSQAELRIAAELARERNMIHAFVNGIDIHWLTAIREIARGGGLVDLVKDTAKKLDGSILSYSESVDLLIKAGHEVCIEANNDWKEYRKKAKAVNFGYLYGMWWKKFKSVARDDYDVIITDEEAEASRVTFFNNYSDLEPWYRRQKRYVRKHGYVKSLSGRKRRLPEARSDINTPERRAAERKAINSPVQSFANEINLMAAIQLREEYGRSIVKICGTVHDSVLFRVRNDMLEEVYHRMLEIMRWPDLMDTFEIEMTVPLEADGEVGPWGKGKPLDKWKEAA